VTDIFDELEEDLRDKGIDKCECGSTEFTVMISPAVDFYTVKTYHEEEEEDEEWVEYEIKADFSNMVLEYPSMSIECAKCHKKL